MRRFLFAMALFVSCGTLLWAMEEIKSVAPQDKAVVTPLGALQRIVLTLPIEQVEAIWSDRLTMSRMASGTNPTWPLGVNFRIEYSGDTSKGKLQIVIADNPEMRDAVVYDVQDQSAKIQNLYPGKTYYWKGRSVLVDGVDIIAESAEVYSVTVEDIGWRIMYVPNMWNVRDLGGKVAMHGLRIPYGRVYRSGGLNLNSLDEGKTPGGSVLTEEGKAILRDVMKIRSEIDLRADGEIANMTESPAGPQVKYIHYSVSPYADYLYRKGGMDRYGKLMRYFADAENYPVIFHCIGGADRTGTVAFLLEALVGCSTRDIRLDYVFTSFLALRYFGKIDALLSGMDKFGTTEEPLQYKAERFLLQCGLTKEEILAIQRNILGTDDFPVSPILK